MPSDAPTAAAYVDELDAHIAESMRDPEYRAASEDVEHRFEIMRALVALRNRLGLTQKDVAQRMGVGQSTVSGFETEGSDPRLSTVQRYARAVEAECRVSIQVPLHCYWVAAGRAYVETSPRSAQSVRVDPSQPSEKDVAWANAANAKRSSFATAA